MVVLFEHTTSLAAVKAVFLPSSRPHLPLLHGTSHMVNSYLAFKVCSLSTSLNLYSQAPSSQVFPLLLWPLPVAITFSCDIGLLEDMSVSSARLSNLLMAELSLFPL